MLGTTGETVVSLRVVSTSMCDTLLITSELVSFVEVGSMVVRRQRAVPVSPGFARWKIARRGTGLL